LGLECYQRLVEPIVGGIFTARAETLSMQAAMPQFVAMEREYGSLIRAARIQRRERSAQTRSAQGASGARYDQFIAPRRGMSWWMGELAHPIREDLHLKTRVASIRRAEDGEWIVQSIATDTGDSRVWIFDQLCIATPSYVAAELLAGTDPTLADELARVPYASSAIAVLAVKKEEIRPDAFCFGAIVPAIEHRDCLAISLTSEKYDGRCPSDLVLARVFLGGAVRSELVEDSDASLLNRAKRELETLFGPWSPPVFETLVRWPRSMPQYLVGHPTRVGTIMERVASLQGLELIGNAYDGVGIPQCVRGARNAAQRMEKRFRMIEQ
jgi:oxygen-dependent protoporphyrinogen oxidase